MSLAGVRQTPIVILDIPRKYSHFKIKLMAQTLPERKSIRRGVIGQPLNPNSAPSLSIQRLAGIDLVTASMG